MGKKQEDLEAALLAGDDEEAARAAADAAGSTFALVCAIVASVTSVIYGYNRGVMSGAQKFVQDNLGISDGQIEVLIGATSIYSLVGSLAAGWACDRAGRRSTIALSAAMFFAGCAVTSAANGYAAALMAGQLVAGVACGFGLVVAPVYIAEIAPAASRGFLSSIPERLLPSSCSPYDLPLVVAPITQIRWRMEVDGEWRPIPSSSLVPKLRRSSSVPKHRCSSPPPRSPSSVTPPRSPSSQL